MKAAECYENTTITGARRPCSLTTQTYPTIAAKRLAARPVCAQGVGGLALVARHLKYPGKKWHQSTSDVTDRRKSWSSELTRSNYRN